MCMSVTYDLLILTNHITGLSFPHFSMRGLYLRTTPAVHTLLTKAASNHVVAQLRLSQSNQKAQGCGRIRPASLISLNFTFNIERLSNNLFVSLRRKLNFKTKPCEDVFNFEGLTLVDAKCKDDLATLK